MHMAGEQRIAAPRAKVWEALNDPEVLRQCIPGCQSLEKQADDRLAAVAEVKIGPIGARFKGDVQLTDLDAPNGYTITGSGSGGIAGNAKGSARVRLSDDGAGTLVSYDVDAEVGGRMAQLGGPIIDATAKNLAGKFFSKFGEVVGGSAPAETASSAPVAATPASAPVIAAAAGAPPATRTTLWGWVAALIAAILAGYTLGAFRVDGMVIAMVMILLVIVAAAAFELGQRGTGR